MSNAKDLAEVGARGGVEALRKWREETRRLAVVPAPVGKVEVEPEGAGQGQQVDVDEEVALVERATKKKRKKLERGDHAEVADILAREFESRAKVSLVFDRDDLWRYDIGTGLWEVVDREQVTRLVGLLAGMPIDSEEKNAKSFKGSKSNADGVLAYLRSRPRGEFGKGFFDAAPEGVAVPNGFVKMKGGEVVLEACEWTHRVRDRMPIAFDRTAVAPTWLESLEDWFEGDPDGEDKVAFLQEFVGACLLGFATRFQKCAILVGEGANGKSVFVEVVTALFPHGTVTAVPPHDFSDERMGAALDRSRLNAVSEVPERAILASEGFKAAVSGDLMTRREAYCKAITFKPRAGHLFAANRLPVVTDTSDGFWRRAVVVGFNQRFEGERCDRGLASRIIKSELEGVFAWAVEGASRLERRGRFTLPSSSGNALDEWRRESNPVELWLDERCERSGWTDATALFDDFARWTHANGFKLLSSREFGKRMIHTLGRDSKRKSSRSEYGATLRIK